MKGLIGKGGFGVVYRATLVSEGDFQTEVAVKLLKSEEISRPMLARFKDEARVLGLIRDRAVVRVFPPAMLDGTPALIMEYVDGQSTSGLLKRLREPLPQRVVTEIVAEVARSLHDVYNQPGPTGEPLRLVHRDIKPGNIQVTPNGTVKLLDFGIAKAAFEGRESETTVHLFGTPQYMAPERLQGRTGPASDVFSLACTWRRLMTGDRPIGGGQFKRSARQPPQTRMLEEALAFCDRMLAVEEEDRPDAAEVHEVCSDLAHRMGGASLRKWASEHVTSEVSEPDDLTGTVIMDSIAVDSAVFDEGMPTAGPTGTVVEPETQSGAVTIERATAERAMLGLGLAAVALILLGGLGGSYVLWRFLNQPPAGVQALRQPVDAAPVPVVPPSPPVEPSPAQPSPEPRPEPIPGPQAAPTPPAPVPPAGPAPVAAPTPEPVVAAPEPVPTTPQQEPEPAPPEPAPAPVPTPASDSRILIDPGGAVVILRGADGARVDPGPLPPGRYDLTVAFDKARPSDVDSPLPTLVLEAGAELRIRCLAASRRCVQLR